MFIVLTSADLASLAKIGKIEDPPCHPRSQNPANIDGGPAGRVIASSPRMSNFDKVQREVGQGDVSPATGGIGEAVGQRWRCAGEFARTLTQSQHYGRSHDAEQGRQFLIARAEASSRYR